MPPLYELSKRLVSQGVKTVHVLGFQTKSAVFYEEAFSCLGPTFIATADGSYGTKGFVTDAIKQREIQFDVLYACGPTPMLKALETAYPDKKFTYRSKKEWAAASERVLPVFAIQVKIRADIRIKRFAMTGLFLQRGGYFMNRLKVELPGLSLKSGYAGIGMFWFREGIQSVL